MIDTVSRNIPQLITVLADKDQSKQIRAAQALVEIGQPVLVDLVETLDTFDDEQWLFSAAIFVEVGKPAVNVLAKALLTRLNPARKRIIWILGYMGDKEGYESLLTTLASEDASIKEITLNALMNIVAFNIRALLQSPKAPLVRQVGILTSEN